MALWPGIPVPELLQQGVGAVVRVGGPVFN